MRLDKFADFYLSYLKNELDGLNLTRITDRSDFFFKQIEDSVFPLEKVPLMPKMINEIGYLVDLGFGGGFPILPLREVIDEKVKIVGVDARKKKVDAVRKISNSYKQKNITFIHSRIEDVLFDEKVVFTIKAVGDINKVLKLINCRIGSYAFFYKGRNLDELEPKYKVNKSWKFIEEVKFLVGDYERTIVVFKKTEDIILDKTLVKLSQFVFN